MNMSMIWLFILVAAGIFEALTVDLVSVWFCFGAVAAMLASYQGVGFWPQIAIFTVVSVLCILLSRPLAKKLLRGEVVHTNADRLIGRHAVITKAIPAEERGEAKIGGEIWLAVASDNHAIAADTKVEIIAIDGAKLVVRPL